MKHLYKYGAHYEMSFTIIFSQLFCHHFVLSVCVCVCVIVLLGVRCMYVFADLVYLLSFCIILV